MMIKYFFCSAISLATIMISSANDIYNNSSYIVAYFAGYFTSLLFSLLLKRFFKRQIGNQIKNSFFIICSIFEIFFFFQIELKILNQNSKVERILCLNRLSFLILRFLLVSKLLHNGKKRILLIILFYGMNILIYFFINECEINFTNLSIVCFGLISFFWNFSLFDKMENEPFKKIILGKLVKEFSDSHFLIKIGKINEVVFFKGSLLKKFYSLSNLKAKSKKSKDLKECFLNDLFLIDRKALDSIKNASQIHNNTININRNLDCAEIKLENLINEHLIFEPEDRIIKLQVQLRFELSLDYFLFAKKLEIYDQKYVLFYLSKDIHIEKKNWKEPLVCFQNTIGFYFNKLKDDITSLMSDLENTFCDINLEINPFELFQSFFSSFEILQAKVENFIHFELIQTKQNSNCISSIKISSLLKDTQKVIEPFAKLKGIEFLINIDESLFDFQIKADFAKLKCILIIFLANALQSAFKNGKVQLKIEVIREHQNDVKISILDSGIGMDETQLNELVSKLNETDLNFHEKNDGIHKDFLGLKILKYLLDHLYEDNGFRITSDKNKGSCIEFYLETIRNDEKLDQSLKLFTLTSPKELSKLHTETEKTATDRDNSLDIYLKSKSYHSRKINKKASYYKIKGHLGSSTLTSTKASKFYSQKNGDTFNSSQVNSFSGNSLSKLSCTSIPEIQKLNLCVEKNCKCKKIIVIDPDTFSLVSMKTLLNSLKHKPEISFTGKDAIEKLFSQNQCTDIGCKGFQMIFVNFNMQLMDSINVVKDISKLMFEQAINEIPIVGYTSIISKEQVKESLKTEIKEMIFYPITKKKIQTCLEKWTNLLSQ